jgi:cob(I)alamin adenosyltransferase
VELLLGVLIGLTAAALGLEIRNAVVLKQVQNRLTHQLSEFQKQNDHSFQRIHQEHAELLARMEARFNHVQVDFTRELDAQRAHLDGEQLKRMEELKRELNQAIDRLENFLREPLI